MVLEHKSRLWAIGLSHPLAADRRDTGTAIFSACPSQVSVLRKASNFASSVKFRHVT